MVEASMVEQWIQKCRYAVAGRIEGHLRTRAPLPHAVTGLKALAAPPALPAARLQAAQARVRDLEQQMDRLAEHLNSTEVGTGVGRAHGCVCWGGVG